MKCDDKIINTEFEHYFQNIKNSASNSDEKIINLETKLLSTCKKYNNIKVPFKHKQVVKQLAENNNVMLLGQDKDKGAVMMGKGKYTEKSLNLLNSSQFNKLSHDTTRTVRKKIKKTSCKIKNKLSKQDYVKWYDQKNICQ